MIILSHLVKWKFLEIDFRGRDTEKWAAMIRRYTEITELDETVLMELVERIEVGETEKRGSSRFRKVTIRYRYVGDVSGAVGTEA